MVSRFILIFLVLFLLMACSAGEQTDGATVPRQAPQLGGQPGVLATPRPAAEVIQVVPALATHEAQMQAALAANPPVLTLEDELVSDEARLAQELALQDPTFVEYTRDSSTGEPLRNEIMSVRPALPGDLSEETAAQCSQENCFRVELYHYASNIATVGIVDIIGRRVVSVQHLNDAQPEINQRLARLAAEIAVNSPEVIEALGLEPGLDDATMPNVKTALNGSRCERSRHLCVAPTFLVGEEALWAIVDLTDGRLVGIRWTDLGKTSAPALVTERTLQNEYVMENFCEQKHTVSRDGWTLEHILTGSDGLEISNVRFNDRLVLNSAKLVDWHVSYSREEGFGYSDAVGCPMFSSASVIAFNGPLLEQIVDNGEFVGFALVQDFRSPIWPFPCNYRYENRYEFYRDGRFRVIARNYGRGCGNDGIYRPVIRLDLAAVDEGSNNFSEWSGQEWVAWDTEQWRLQTEETPYTPEGYQFKIDRGDGTGYYVEPDRGQFQEGGRGDSAYTYITAKNADRDEGATDMVTIGPCCNSDYQQGPEKFLEPAEPLTEPEFIMWYVPQMKNDDTPGQEYCWADTVIENGKPRAVTWPCSGGPMFVPFETGP